MKTLDDHFAAHVRAVTGQHSEQIPGVLLDTMRRDFNAGASAAVIVHVTAEAIAPVKPSLFERIFGAGP